MARFPQENVPEGYVQGPREVAALRVECSTCDYFSGKVYDEKGAQSGKCFVDHLAIQRVRYVDADGLCFAWKASEPLDAEGG